MCKIDMVFIQFIINTHYPTLQILTKIYLGHWTRRIPARTGKWHIKLYNGIPICMSIKFLLSLAACHPNSK